MTGGQIIDGTLQKLDESLTAPVFWSRAELLVHLNDGFRELNLMVLKVQSESGFATTSLNFQLTPANAIAVIEVRRNQVALRKRTVEGMDLENGGWQRKTGPSKVWGPVGLNLFFVSPKTSSESLMLVLLLHPTAITEVSVIDLDEEYVEALEEYVYHMARFKEGGAEFEFAQSGYALFRERCGFALRRKLVEQPSLFAVEPAANTGISYGSHLRN